MIGIPECEIGPSKIANMHSLHGDEKLQHTHTQVWNCAKDVRLENVTMYILPLLIGFNAFGAMWSLIEVQCDHSLRFTTVIPTKWINHPLYLPDPYGSRREIHSGWMAHHLQVKFICTMHPSGFGQVCTSKVSFRGKDYAWFGGRMIGRRVHRGFVFWLMQKCETKSRSSQPYFRNRIQQRFFPSKENFAIFSALSFFNHKSAKYVERFSFLQCFFLQVRIWF